MMQLSSHRTESDLASLGITFGPSPSPLRGEGRGEVAVSRQPSAARVLALLSDQLANLQTLLDSTFALSLTVTYRTDVLAEEFSVPERDLLRALTQAILSDRLPPCSRVTTDHRLLITLSPNTIPDRYSSHTSHSSHA